MFASHAFQKKEHLPECPQGTSESIKESTEFSLPDKVGLFPLQPMKGFSSLQIIPIWVLLTLWIIPKPLH